MLLSSYMSCFSSEGWEERGEEHNLLIERILLLVRNVLHIPADPYEEKVSSLAFTC